MAKTNPNLKLLLVVLTTRREVDGEMKRVRFGSNSVVELTDDELDLLDRMTVSTGKLHYRDPISEGRGAVAESAPEVVKVPDYAGQDVPMDKKTVDQLKAFLTFSDITFDDKASKADLLALATKSGGDDDKDAGL